MLGANAKSQVSRFWLKKSFQVAQRMPFCVFYRRSLTLLHNIIITYDCKYFIFMTIVHSIESFIQWWFTPNFDMDRGTVLIDQQESDFCATEYD